MSSLRYSNPTPQACVVTLPNHCSRKTAQIKHIVVPCRVISSTLTVSPVLANYITKMDAKDSMHNIQLDTSVLFSGTVKRHLWGVTWVSLQTVNLRNLR